MDVTQLKSKVCAAIKHCPLGERVQRLYLFGSHLHGTAQGDSDVDLLIELTEPISFFQLYNIQEVLEKALGKKVDLATPEFLSKYIREDVMNEAQLLYER